MRKVFVLTSIVLLVVFALQFVFAAVGAFTTPQTDSSYALHSLTGMAVIPALTLLTTLFAFLARAPGRLIGLTVLPLALTILQALLAMLAGAFSDASGGSTVVSLVVGGLHALNGIVVVHIVVAVVRGAHNLAQPRAAVSPDSAAVQSVDVA